MRHETAWLDCLIDRTFHQNGSDGKKSNSSSYGRKVLDRGPLKKVLGVLREFTHVSTQICVQPGTKTQKIFRGKFFVLGITA